MGVICEDCGGERTESGHCLVCSAQTEGVLNATYLEAQGVKSCAARAGWMYENPGHWVAWAVRHYPVTNRHIRSNDFERRYVRAETGVYYTLARYVGAEVYAESVTS